MEDDDPFSIVKPEKDNKKMSTYLKKQRKIAAADRDPTKCAVEESSHGTTSTRSTTASNRTDDNLYPATPSSCGSVRSGGSGSGRRAVESLSSFGNSNHGDDNAEDFGNFEDMNITDNAHAIEFGSDFGNGLEFGVQGGSAFGGGEFGGGNGIGTKSFKIGRASNGRKSSSLESQCQTRKPHSMRDFGGGERDDGFGMDPFAVDPFDASSLDFSQPFEEVPVNFGEHGMAGFESSFFSGGDSATDKTNQTSSSGDAWRKREEWKNDARSNSSSSGKIRDRRHASRRAGLPRRHNSTDGFNLNSPSPDDAPGPLNLQVSRRRLPPSIGSEAAFNDRNDQSSDLSSVVTSETQSRAPPRTRSGRSRRASIDNSGHSGHSGLDSICSNQTEKSDRSRRRGSIDNFTLLESTLDPLPAPSPGPQRNRSTAGASQGSTHAGSRKPRSRRASMSTSGVTGGSWDVDLLPNNDPEATDPFVSSNAGNGKNDNKWARDRSRNQEKILTMYKEGAMKKSDDTQKSFSISDDLDCDKDCLAIHDEFPMDSTRSGFGKILKNPFAIASSGQFGASIGDGDDIKAVSGVASLADSAAPESKRSDRKKSLPSIRLSKSKKEDVEEEKLADAARNMIGRSRGSLLERVGAVDDSALSSASVGAGTKGGSSYSDRILKQQQKSRY